MTTWACPRTDTGVAEMVYRRSRRDEGTSSCGRTAPSCSLARAIPRCVDGAIVRAEGTCERLRIAVDALRFTAPARPPIGLFQSALGAGGHRAFEGGGTPEPSHRGGLRTPDTDESTATSRPRAHRAPGRARGIERVRRRPRRKIERTPRAALRAVASRAMAPHASARSRSSTAGADRTARERL